MNGGRDRAPAEGHDCQISYSQVDSIGFIGPVIPPGDSLQTTCGGDGRGQSLDDCVDTPVDETDVQQNGNGNMHGNIQPISMIL